jgi:hypothetical protein
VQESEIGCGRRVCSAYKTPFHARYSVASCHIVHALSRRIDSAGPRSSRQRQDSDVIHYVSRIEPLRWVQGELPLHRYLRDGGRDEDKGPKGWAGLSKGQCDSSDASGHFQGYHWQGPTFSLSLPLLLRSYHFALRPQAKEGQEGFFAFVLCIAKCDC